MLDLFLATDSANSFLHSYCSHYRITPRAAARLFLLSLEYDAAIKYGSIDVSLLALRYQRNSIRGKIPIVAEVLPIQRCCRRGSAKLINVELHLRLGRSRETELVHLSHCF